MSAESATYAMEAGTCPECGEWNTLIGPLHGASGGPVMCIRCSIEWHAKHSRLRKMGRIVVKALKAYFAAGGSDTAIYRLKAAALGVVLYDSEADTIGADVGDITSELLEDTIRLTHPDRHPPERHDAAARVTRELLALKPFVFPAPKPEETPPITPPRDTSDKVHADSDIEPLRIEYPCEVCRDQVPYYYCKTCMVTYERLARKKRDWEHAKRRAWYKWRRERQLARRGATTCQACGEQFKPKRKDARYCSATCRQQAHRQRVTDKNRLHGALGCIRDGASP